MVNLGAVVNNKKDMAKIRRAKKERMASIMATITILLAVFGTFNIGYWIGKLIF